MNIFYAIERFTHSTEKRDYLTGWGMEHGRPKPQWGTLEKAEFHKQRSDPDDLLDHQLRNSEIRSYRVVTVHMTIQ